MKIKICGLKRVEDIEIVNKYKPDYVGFVFAESKRQISISQAEELINQLDFNIKPVGVFVNQTIEFVMSSVEAGIKIIQLHGDEDEAYINELRKFNILIIKAVRVSEKSDIEIAEKLPCDYLLLDTYVKNEYGGSGKSFDWSLIPKNIQKPYFLAGGINMGNIKEAAKTGAYCLDISSGAEENGLKSADKIKEIMDRSE